jgi:hypothetical protein
LGPTTTTSPLLEPAPARPPRSTPSPEVLVDLVDMAFSERACNLLSARFHTMLAGHLGKPGAEQVLLGVQELVSRGEAAGARFLAAFLDVTTPGARLIPLIQGFTSSRRVKLQLTADSRPANPMQTEWLRRAEQVSRETADLLDILGIEPFNDPDHPGREAPWPAWRRCFLHFLDDVIAGRGLMPDSRKLMAELIRLETDAWLERTSNLAGTVNPFNTAAVRRVLPVLSESDSLVHDLKQLGTWIEAGNDGAAFTNRVSCALEVMDESDHERLRDLIQQTPSLATLADLSQALHAEPLEISYLAGGTGLLMAVTHQMVLAGIREKELGLLGCVRLVQRFRQGNKIRLPLTPDLATSLREMLKSPVRNEGVSLWPLRGIRVLGETLELDITDTAAKDRWEHFLPTGSDHHPRAVAPPKVKLDENGEPVEEDPQEEKSEDLTASAIKHLVMSNIMSTSVTLGFLRNPKVTAIPGLVAEVATRTRNPQIIETIATDRALYTGFANRDVPRICLQSPCNTSVKTLRKFIHVKYVNKVDLRRMANDRAGMRREVIREIDKYLEALA